MTAVVGVCSVCVHACMRARSSRDPATLALSPLASAQACRHSAHSSVFPAPPPPPHAGLLARSALAILRPAYGRGQACTGPRVLNKRLVFSMRTCTCLPPATLPPSALSPLTSSAHTLKGSISQIKYLYFINKISTS